MLKFSITAVIYCHLKKPFKIEIITIKFQYGDNFKRGKSKYFKKLLITGFDKVGQLHITDATKGCISSIRKFSLVKKCHKIFMNVVKGRLPKI